MGIFQDNCIMVNRTSKPLELIFDGQRMILQPNYNEKGERIEGVINTVPRVCIPYALNQNVRMGTEDAIDPSSFESLVGVEADSKDRKTYSWHDCSYIEQTEALTRTPLEDVLEDPTAKIQVRGKKIPRAVDAAVPGTSQVEFRR